MNGRISTAFPSSYPIAPMGVQQSQTRVIVSPFVSQSSWPISKSSLFHSSPATNTTSAMLTTTDFIAPVRGSSSAPAATVATESKRACRSLSVTFESFPADTMSPPTGVQRSSSCPDESERSARLASLYPHRIQICCDDKLRMRLQQNAKQLLATAADANSSCNNALLAKKALKHRKILARMADVDVNDPSFDVSKFLGVNWTKQQARA